MKQEASPNSRGGGEGYDKERREAGVESNHTWRGRPLPAQNHKSKSRREREREMIERREREERGERGETHRALCRAKTAKCGRAPDRADLRPLTII